MSYTNELSLIWKIFSKAFRWDLARFCSIIRLDASLNWINMVCNDKYQTDVNTLVSKKRYNSCDVRLITLIAFFLNQNKRWRHNSAQWPHNDICILQWINLMNIVWHLFYDEIEYCKSILWFWFRSCEENGQKWKLFQKWKIFLSRNKHHVWKKL